MDDYLEGVHSAWLGERMGHQFFTEMANAADSEQHAKQWQTLARLESVTGGKMAEVMKFWGTTPNEDEVVPISPEVIDRYRSMSHDEAMAAMKSTIEVREGFFDRLLAIAPDNDVEAIGFLVAHEQALLSFVECEMAGESDKSLDATLTLLEGATA